MEVITKGTTQKAFKKALQEMENLARQGYTLDESKRIKAAHGRYYFSVKKVGLVTGPVEPAVDEAQGYLPFGGEESETYLPTLDHSYEELTKKDDLIAWAESYNVPIPDHMKFPAQIKKHIKEFVTAYESSLIEAVVHGENDE